MRGETPALAQRPDTAWPVARAIVVEQTAEEEEVRMSLPAAHSGS